MGPRQLQLANAWQNTLQPQQHFWQAKASLETIVGTAQVSARGINPASGHIPSPQLLPAGSASLGGISDPSRAPRLTGAQWELHIQR